MLFLKWNETITFNCAACFISGELKLEAIFNPHLFPCSELILSFLCVQGCTDLIALFEEEEQRREAELEEIRRKGEVEGVWEVQKILEVKTRKVSFVFIPSEALSLRAL